MSRLKQLIAQKLNANSEILNLYGEHTEGDILFCKNGNRTDVIRWMGMGDLHCFYAGYESVGENIKFTKCELPNCSKVSAAVTSINQGTAQRIILWLHT